VKVFVKLFGKQFSGLLTISAPAACTSGLDLPGHSRE